MSTRLQGPKTPKGEADPCLPSLDGAVTCLPQPGAPEDMAMYLSSELGTQRNNTAFRQLRLIRRQLTKPNESLLCDSLP